MITQITDRERELAAENERLLAANLDCIAWFDALKTDYDKLREAAKLGLEALDGTEALLSSMDVTHLLIYGEVGKAITALKEALGEQA